MEIEANSMPIIRYTEGHEAFHSAFRGIGAFGVGSNRPTSGNLELPSSNNATMCYFNN
jgi:hypothetical protein